MDPDVHPDLYYDRRKHHNAEMKPRPPQLIRDSMYGPAYHPTHGPFIDHHRPAMMSPTGQAYHPSPRICDDQYVRAAHSRPQDMNRRRTCASPPRMHRVPIHFIPDANQKHHEMMTIESQQHNSPTTHRRPNPQPPVPDTRIEDILLKFLEVQEKSSEAIHAKIDSYKTETKAKLNEVLERVTKVEKGLEDINSQIHFMKRDIMEQESKITNLHYKIEGVEDNLEWKIEALQSGFADPREYSEWKCSEEYEAYGEEEKLRLEKQVAERKSWRPVFYREDKVREDFGLPVPEEGVATELPQPQNEAEALASHSPSYFQKEGKSLNFSNPCETLSLTLQEPKATEVKEESMSSSVGAEEKEDLAIKTEEEPADATNPWPHDERTSLRPVSLRPHGRALDPRPADPRPHGQAHSPRSPTGPAQTSLGPQPHDAATSLRSPSPRPHGRAPTMRQTTVPDQPPDDPRTEEVTDQLPPTRDHVPRLRSLSPHGQTLGPQTAAGHDPPSQLSDHDHDRVPRSIGPSAREPNIDPQEATGPDQRPETDSDCEPEPALHQTYDHDPPAPNRIEPGDVMDVREEEESGFSSDDLDEDEEETNVVYSCTATKFPSNKVPEDEALKQLQRELHDQGTPRPRNPPPSRVARRLPPVPLQTRFQHPYPRANVYQQNQFEGSQVSFRLPQQVFHSQEIGISKQVKHIGQPENLLAQYLEYVKMIEKTTRERLDKMDSILCGKIDEISAFVKCFGEKYARDAEEFDKRFRRIESEIGSCFIGGQDHAGRLEDSNKMTKAVGDRLDHFSIETVRKLTDVLSYIDLLQRRAISSECTIQKILVRQDNLEEAFLDESRKIIGSHDHTSAILRAARVLREEADRRANLPREESIEARQRVVRRQDEITEG